MENISKINYTEHQHIYFVFNNSPLKCVPCIR